MKSVPTIAKVLFMIGVPVLIGILYTWWMGLICLVLSFVLNSGLVFLLGSVLNVKPKAYIPYVRMTGVALVLFALAHLICR
jgi:hypothetical protein